LLGKACRLASVGEDCMLASVEEGCMFALVVLDIVVLVLVMAHKFVWEAVACTLAWLAWLACRLVL